MLLILATVAYLLVALPFVLVVGRGIALGLPSDDDLALAGPHTLRTPTQEPPAMLRLSA